MFQKTLSLFVPDIPRTLSHSSHMPAASQGSNPNSTFEASALPRVSGAGENFTVYMCVHMYVCDVLYILYYIIYYIILYDIILYYIISYNIIL